MTIIDGAGFLVRMQDADCKVWVFGVRKYELKSGDELCDKFITCVVRSGQFSLKCFVDIILF